MALRFDHGHSPTANDKTFIWLIIAPWEANGPVIVSPSCPAPSRSQQLNCRNSLGWLRSTFHRPWLWIRCTRNWIQSSSLITFAGPEIDLEREMQFQKLVKSVHTSLLFRVAFAPELPPKITINDIQWRRLRQIEIPSSFVGEPTT